MSRGRFATELKKFKLHGSSFTWPLRAVIIYKMFKVGNRNELAIRVHSYQNISDSFPTKPLKEKGI